MLRKHVLLVVVVLAGCEPVKVDLSPAFNGPSCEVVKDCIKAGWGAEDECLTTACQDHSCLALPRPDAASWCPGEPDTAFDEDSATVDSDSPLEDSATADSDAAPAEASTSDSFGDAATDSTTEATDSTDG
jgi:hypothetical protein